MPTEMYFSFVVIIGILSGWLTYYALNHQSTPGARPFIGVSASQFLLAAVEVLMMVSGSHLQAYFWFRLRFLFIAIMPVFWFLFALEYSGRNYWLSRRLIISLSIIPFLTQVLLWSNPLHSIWLIQDVVFQPVGDFWDFQTHTRIPGFWYLVHIFYSMSLLFISNLIILLTAWKQRGEYRAQLILVAIGATLSFAVGLRTSFNLFPNITAKVFTPGFALSSLFYALAIFRFKFLEGPLFSTSHHPSAPPDAQEKRSLAFMLLIFVIMTAGASAIGWLSYQNYERDFRRAVDQQLSAITELKIKDLQAWKEERLHDAETIYNNPAFTDLVMRFFAKPEDENAGHQLQSWIQLIQRSYRYNRVFLLDTLGNERLSSPPQPEIVADHLHDEIPEVLKSNTIMFVDFHRDQKNGAIYLSFLVPIYADQDAEIPLGILVLRVDPYEFLYPSLKRWPGLSNTAETLLVRRSGNEVLYLNPLRFKSDAALNLRISVENSNVLAVKAAMGYTGVTEGLDYRGNQVIGVLQAVPDTPWFLVTRMDTSEVYAPLRERIWLIVLTVGTIVFAAAAGLVSVWHQMRINYLKARSEAAESLRISEERYRTVANYTYAWDYWIAPDGTLLYISPSCERITGYSPNDFLSNPSLLDTIVLPEDQSTLEFHKIDAQQIEQREDIHQAEFRIKRRDGEIRWIEHVCQMIKRPDGVNLGRRATNQDITKRKLAEDARRQSENLLNKIFDLLPVGLWLADKNGQLIRSNTAGRAIWGAEPLVGQEQYGVFKARRLPEGKEIGPDDWALAHTIREGVTITNEMLEIDAFDGMKRTILNFTSPLVDEQGQIEGAVIVNLDISDRKRAEDALRASEERLRLAITAANLGLYDLNVQTGETIVNDQYARMLGYDPATFHETNAAWIERLHPDDRKPVADLYQDYIAGRISEYRVEFRQRTPSGDWKWILSLGKLVERDEQGHPLRMLGIHMDITERKHQENRLLDTQAELQRLLAEMEERVENRTTQLAASNRELEAFAYSVSHDLRAPLRAIDGFARILHQDYEHYLDEEGKRLLEIIRTNTSRMDQLIKDLLALSRVSRIELTYSVIDMTSLVNSVYHEIASPEVQQSFQLTVDTLPPAEGDATLLRQAWTNLISNAIKYTIPKNERMIHISGFQQGGINTYSIRDNGVGFNPQYANKLFVLFQRLHKSGEFDGTGVGLAIVQRIIHRHSGQIWGEGVENQGATFYFTLPNKRMNDE